MEVKPIELRHADKHLRETWVLAGRGRFASLSTHRLVAKQDVDVRHDLHQGLFKELADERGREVHAEDLVVV